MARISIEIIMCLSELHVINFVLMFSPDSTDVAKYNYVIIVGLLMAWHPRLGISSI